MRIVATAFFLLFCFSIPIETTLMPLGFGVISTAIGAVAMAVLLPCLIFEQRIRLYGPPVLLWVGFLLYMCATAIWSIRVTASLGMMQTFVSLAALVILVVNSVGTNREANAAIRAYGLGCVIAAVMTVIAQRSGQFSDVGRTVINEFIDANEFAMTLCLGVPGLIAWLNESKSKILRVLLLLASVFILYAALLTGSRMGFIMVVAIMAYGFSQFISDDSYSYTRPQRVLIVSVVSVTVVLVVLMGLQQETIDRLSRLGDSNNRDSLAVAGLKALEDSTLVGSGLATSPYALLPYTGERYVVHNSFLNIAVDGGLVGLALFLASLGSAALPALKVFRFRKEYLTLVFVVFLGTMALHVEHRKMIWVMLPLVVIGAARYRSEVAEASP